MAASPASSREVDAAAGAAPAAVRVRNLQTTVAGPHDAWGRPGRPQPLLVSACVALRQPFGASSARDALAADTVHYGQLAKAVLASLAAPARAPRPAALADVLMRLWADLVGLDLARRPAPRDDGRGPPFLDLSVVRGLQLTALLPKASLLGDGASLTFAAVFADGPAGPALRSYARTLRLHNLRVPTLVGINDNEREAKQAVVVNVAVDNHEGSADIFTALEARIVARMTDSSFGTLEALAAHLAETITVFLRQQQQQQQQQEAPDGPGSHLVIKVEKPMAVPLADAPCVELRTSTKDVIVPMPQAQESRE